MSARAAGWLAYHTHDSRRSEPGFPDAVFVRDGRIVFAELKAARGRVTPEQRAWLEALGKAAGGAVSVFSLDPGGLGGYRSNPGAARLTGRRRARVARSLGYGRTVGARADGPRRVAGAPGRQSWGGWGAAA